METLVVVAQHRNQYSSRVKPHGPARFVSSPSRHFTEINCRTFQSGVGILPTPFNASTNVSKQAPSSPKTPVQNICSNLTSNTAPKSAPIPINIKAPRKETTFNEVLPFSERWAGPAYSNSPPPSSLPIPKFSMRPKRTVSLDLHVRHCGIEVHAVAKSAPASPTRGHGMPSRDLFFRADTATKTLRRILNLDREDD
ncbi:hypothetical protein K2173_018491 [Erythroxylum novogranatense]|uniref:Uncharacterized protein n=1 Tax=Erythroxylum novogranatense TaxID=1862640 RepID=A0AAV8UE16_9ROSI|nr:hypothetical protein K2173_018491 [Erythroxylum novogranatense]